MLFSKRKLVVGTMAWSGLLSIMERFARRPGLVVFNYHRVGSLAQCPFDEGVFSADREQFRKQVEYLSKHFEVLRLEDLLAIAEAGFAFRRPTALLTFDDGYRDNYTTAFPVLKDSGIAATFFIITSQPTHSTLPWWDRIAYVIKNTRVCELVLDYPVPAVFDWKRVTRPTAIQQVLRSYKDAPEISQDQFFAHLEERAEVAVDAGGLAQDLFMSWPEIRELVAGGMSIGSHTHTHPILARLTAEEQQRELCTSWEVLQSELGQPVAALSYPVGGPGTFDGTTKRLARAAGYRLGFSYYGGAVRPGHADLFDIQRISVDHDMSLSLLRARSTMLSAWGRSI